MCMDRPGLGHDTAMLACHTAETWAATRRGRATIQPSVRATRHVVRAVGSWVPIQQFYRG